MEHVTVSKKYRVLIPKKLRKKVRVKAGDKMLAIIKHGILHYVRVRPIKDTKGWLHGLDTEELRDEQDRD